MRQRDSSSIGDIYGKMLNTFKYNINESTKIKKGGNDLSDKHPLELEDGGPSKKGGYNKALNDKIDKVEDEEDETEATSNQYLPKRVKTTEKLQDKLKDPKLTDKAKKDIKDQINLRQGEEAEEDDDNANDYAAEMWKDKFRKDKQDKNWSKNEIGEAIEDEDNKNIKESKKIATKTLNNFMSKSVFDKLYSKVLRENFGQEDEGSDIDALGLDDATPDSDMDEFGDEDGLEEDGDSVTFTLDRATAKTLIDVLQGALGEEDGGMEDEGDDLDFGDEGEDEGEDDKFNFEEDEEVQGTKVAPDKKKTFQAKSNKVGGKVKPHKKAIRTDVTDGVESAGNFSDTIDYGKSNQVKGSTLKRGAEFFK